MLLVDRLADRDLDDQIGQGLAGEQPEYRIVALAQRLMRGLVAEGRPAERLLLLLHLLLLLLLFPTLILLLLLLLLLLPSFFSFD